MIERVFFPASRPGLPVIVMLHEGLGSVSHWKDFPQRLASASGAGVFVYSRRGHGNSPPWETPRGVDYLHREAEMALPALLEEEGIESPILFGHSDGASIALLYAARFPAAALILEAPHVFVEDMTVGSIAKAAVAYQTTDLPRRLARYHADSSALFWAWHDIWLDPGFRNWNIEACLERIHCPVLVIQGAGDEFGTMAQVAAIQAKIPSAQTLVLAACGHSPHRDQPDATLAQTIGFLGSRIDGTG